MRAFPFLKLESNPVVSTNPVLQLGVTNTNKYGNKFQGISNYPNSVNFDIPASDQDFTLNLDGFDIDAVAEVSVQVNGQLIGNLSLTPNNGISADTLTIPASLVNANGNVLSFTQNVPGWTWGVTNLVLTQSAALSLNIDVSDSNSYGFGYNGIYTNRDTARFEFISQGTDLVLHVDTFDIDTGREISVALNGQTVGYLDQTANNGTGYSVLVLPASSQTNGTNSMVFSQSVSGWTWGITNTLLVEKGATRLTPDLTHPKSYGYGFNGVNSTPEKAEFVFAASDQNLKLLLTGYDIDTDDEIAIELNANVIGHLAKTPNNAQGPTEFLIPSHLLAAGDNTLTFRQKNINWRWGIKDILLQTQPDLVPKLNDYELVFSDEFNSGSLDGSKWNTGMLWGPYLTINDEQQLYVVHNCSRQPGLLRMPRFGITTLNTNTTDPMATTPVINQTMLIISRAS